MNFKKAWKRFFSLSRHNDGFTLVELIVVIAILAILAGVGVPAYSGYIEKTNMGADQTLIRDVKQALELYYYSHPDSVASGYVVLNQEGTAAEADAVGDAAMQAVFGENWKDTVGLKYSDWNGDTSAAASYANTSYYGNEGSLLGEVDRLTNALGGAVTQYNISLGENFTEFLGKHGLSDSSDATAIGNAAVLYVAQQTAGNEEFIKQTFEQNLTSANFVNDTYTSLSAKVGDAAALAAIYAYAEGFAQYCDAQEGSTTNAVETFHNAADFSGTTDAASALNAINTAFNALGVEGQQYITDYMATGDNSPGLSNVDGYVGIMGTVDSNKAVVDGNLAADDCFTDGTVENLLTGYASMSDISAGDGQVAIKLLSGNGAVSTHVSPMNWNE